MAGFVPDPVGDPPGSTVLGVRPAVVVERRRRSPATARAGRHRHAMSALPRRADVVSPAGHVRSIGALECLTLVAPQSIRHQQVTSPSQWNYFFSPVPVPVVVAAPVVVPVPVPVAVPVRRS